MPITWEHARTIESSEYVCYYCGKYVAGRIGFIDKTGAYKIMICPNTRCNKPTYFHSSLQIPSPSLGSPVAHLPPDTNALYEEARACTSVNAFTSVVLAGRKLLMHIAVEKGAKAGQRFAEYVDYLSNEGYVPPGSKEWVDLIRTKGNEANHEIVLMSKEDAEQLLVFLEMLLKFIYEFPGKIQSKALPEQANP